jgi:PEP-CTERM motif
MEVQMKRLVAMLVLVAGVSVFATPVNITVVGYDTTSTWPGKYVNLHTNVPPGDNETMPGTLQGNSWDMEAVLLSADSLSLVGSWNWAKGYDGDKTGDLFIATNGSASYNYALVFDYKSDTYTAYQLNANTQYTHTDNIHISDPLGIVTSTATDIGSYGFQYTTGLSDDAALGYTSWEAPVTHNEIAVDLGNFLVLQTGEEIATHITMSCGNDELNGFGKVPEPGSLSMILVGLLSLAGLAVSKKRK